MYQIEGESDFTIHETGSDESSHNDSTELHWSIINVDNNAPNYRRLVPSLDHSGIVSSELFNLIEIPDSSRYYVKLKIKINSNAPDTTSVVRVRVIGNNKFEKILHVSDFPNNSWNELEIMNFYKAATGPEMVANPPLADHIKINDSVGIGGIQDFETTTTSYTPYDIEIYWFGLVNCDLDYITIEDIGSHALHNGNYDSAIDTGANQFRSKSALYSYKLWDEPDPPNFLPIRYANNLVNSQFSNGGSAYNNIKSSQQYLAQTKLNINRCDVYPLGYYATKPGQSGYTSNFQDSLQINFIPHLIEEIEVSKNFSVPFWLTVQAHRWIDPDRGPILREPSAYEIKLMANLGIGYGAKGIEYFMFSKPNAGASTGFLDFDDNKNPVPRDTDEYGFNKWNIVKDLNAKIASQGTYLMPLKWDSSFYLHDTTIQGRYITNINSYTSVNPHVHESPAYVQLSFFEPLLNNYNHERFFVINRNTLINDYRNLQITYNKTQTNPGSYTNWTIREISTSNYWSGRDTGSFNTIFDPAEGKLFTLEPSVINGGDLKYDETITGTDTLLDNLIIKPGVTLTVSGIYQVKANITVDSGAGLVVSATGHLNIQSGSIIGFANNTGITVHGNLNANGVTFQNSGTTNWGYLTFEPSPGASLGNQILSNCSIKNCQGIRCIGGGTSATISINNCLISKSIEGIYIYNSQPTILNNIIDDPYYSGIYADASGYNLLIQGNSINRIPNLNNDMGIWLTNNTSANIMQNNISGFFWGVCLEGGSYLGTDRFFNECSNRITGNYAGVGSLHYSFADLGDEDSWGGKGSGILNNTTFDELTLYHSDYRSWYDYYGSSPKLYNDDSSWVEILAMKETDPCGNQQKAIVKKNVSSTNSLAKISDANFSVGIKLEKDGRTDDAIAFYKTLYNKDIYVGPLLTRLALIENKYSKPEITDYFESLLASHNKHYGKIKNLLGNIYLQNNQFSKAISYYNDVISNSSTDYDAINARFEKLFGYVFIQHNISLASQILSDLKGMDLKDTLYLSRIRIAENLISGMKSGLAKGKSIQQNNVPVKYSLAQNYPNPFNPTTTISYSLSKPGNVTLKIYDILGREITTIVNEYKNEGNFTASFNASKFASGVYIYQLRSGSFVDTKKMVLTK